MQYEESIVMGCGKGGGKKLVNSMHIVKKENENQRRKEKERSTRTKKVQADAHGKNIGSELKKQNKKNEYQRSLSVIRT